MTFFAIVKYFFAGTLGILLAIVALCMGLFVLFTLSLTARRLFTRWRDSR